MAVWKTISETIKSIKMFKQQNGSILVISAMMLPIMLACLGFAYDFGNLYMHKVRLQNIADAAALAGGRAYLESQEKPTKRDEYDKLSYPNYTGWKKEYGYKVGDSVIHKHTTSVHPDADNAADDYICKNVVNLGTTVYSDVFSHYALESLGAGSASTGFSEDLSHVGSPKIFYRIGLYEQVPLYFLPIILNRKEHRVRAGSVVLIDEGAGIVDGNTLFDQLFVVQDGISFVNNKGVNIESSVIVDANNQDKKYTDKNSAKIHSTFDGGIVFAKKFTSGSTGGIVDYFYTAAEKAYQKSANLSIKDMTGTFNVDETGQVTYEGSLSPNMGGKAVWDNSIGMDSYVSGFLKKLSRPHNDLKKNTIKTNGATNGVMTTFSTQSLNYYKNKDTLINKHYTIDNLDNKGPHYYQADNSNNIKNSKIIFCLPRLDEDFSGWAYWLCDSDPESGYYYHFRTEGYAFKIGDKNIICYTYVLDNKGNQIFCDYNKNNKPKWTFYRKNVTTTTTDGVTKTVVDYTKLDTDNNKLAIDDTNPNPNETKYSYEYPSVSNSSESNSSESFTFRLKKVPFDFSQGVRVNEPQIKYSEVYHWEQEGQSELKLNVDEIMGEEGDEYNPVYIILTGGRLSAGSTNGTNSTSGEEAPKDIETKIKIEVKYTNYRPVIFCNLTNYEISELKIWSGQTFKGIIYSPFSKVVYVENKKDNEKWFKGNIIAKELVVQDPNTHFIHQNFVVNDFDLNQVSDADAQEQKDRKQEALEFAKEKLYSEANVPIAAWNEPDWFGSLTDANYKKTVQLKWREVRELLWTAKGLDMPDWPWKDGGKPIDTNQHHYSIFNNETGSTGEKLRIINTRTEYTIEPYINPFNNCSLSDD